MAKYTAAEFASELEDSLSGRPPAECLGCARTGFYGPRLAPPRRRYRLCKFCGFYQAVSEDADQLRPCVHGCKHLYAGAPYITWVPAGASVFTCGACKAEGLDVESYVGSAPTEDPGHLWWKVPQNLSAVKYREFWNANGASGSVYL